MIGAVLTAGGAGVRFGGEKILAVVCGEPLIFHTLRRVKAIEGVREIVLTLPADRLPEIRETLGARLGAAGVTRYAEGGATRQDSVSAGLAALPPEIDLVLVHDAVRPVFSVAAAERALFEAGESGAAIVGVPVRDTLKRVDSEQGIESTVERSRVWHAETPQVARREILETAFARAREDGFTGTDEASLLERIGQRVVLVRGAPFNVKVTEPEDIPVVEALIRSKDDA